MIFRLLSVRPSICHFLLLDCLPIFWSQCQQVTSSGMYHILSSFTSAEASFCLSIGVWYLSSFDFFSTVWQWICQHNRMEDLCTCEYLCKCVHLHLHLVCAITAMTSDWPRKNYPLFWKNPLIFLLLFWKKSGKGWFENQYKPCLFYQGQNLWTELAYRH